MASHAGQSQDSRYDRDSINTDLTSRSKKNAPLTHLARFVVDEKAADAIQRTANYARDPKTYLESNLGNRNLSERSNLLCIPPKVDRDYYGAGGEHKQHFEQHLAKLFGKEHGLFFITGVQAQLIVMKIYANQAGKKSVAWHLTSHLECAEQDAYKELYGLDRILLGSDPDNLPTVEEITEVINLPEQDRPAAILIEIPNRELGCQTYSFSDLETISSACRAAGVKFHMDGARIWEIEPYFQHNYNRSFADIGRLFDSMYVSFYKGLRGSTGAMLLGPDAAFIDEARKWQRRSGGNTFQATYEVLDCQRGYNENIGTFDSKWRKMVEIVDGVVSATSKFKDDDGEPIIEFWPQKPQCCQIRTAIHGFTENELTSARDRVEEKLNARVFERLFKDPRQRRKEVVATKPNGAKEDKSALMEVPQTATAESKSDETRYMIEWMIVKPTLSVATKLFVDAYVLLCEELLAGRRR